MNPLSLYSQIVRELPDEKRREFAEFFIGALSLVVNSRDWLDCLALTINHITPVEEE